MTHPGFDRPPVLADDGMRYLTEKEWDSPSCKVCLNHWDTPRATTDLKGGVLSPRGVWHAAKEYGMTYCGKDATPDGWWWPC